MAISFHPDLVSAHADRVPQPPRLLIVPGLHNSGPTHWQSWLQSLHPSAVRVEQRDWAQPLLDRWAARITSTLDRQGDGPWLVAAHSFGCLALVRHLVLQPDTRVAGVLLVAPADPDKFGVAGLLPQGALTVPGTMVVSNTDPWMRAAAARAWAQRWGCHTVNLGDAGHINTASGFGPLPLAQRWVVSMQQVLSWVERRDRADVSPWSFAL
ncbi:MAG: alpha/beta hydrolase [Pseudomonadota bacterium]|nr:alpha/beta hydrolase [Pseudomonadota bacterium]